MRKIDLSKYRKAQNVRIIDDDEENIMPIDYSKYKKANLSQEAVDIINDYDQHNNKNKMSCNYFNKNYFKIKVIYRISYAIVR